jgi:hypothetical protein
VAACSECWRPSHSLSSPPGLSLALHSPHSSLTKWPGGQRVVSLCRGIAGMGAHPRYLSLTSNTRMSSSAWCLACCLSALVLPSPNPQSLCRASSPSLPPSPLLLLSGALCSFLLSFTPAVVTVLPFPRGGGWSPLDVRPQASVSCSPNTPQGGTSLAHRTRACAVAAASPVTGH